MTNKKTNRREFLKTTCIYGGMMVFANACTPWYGKSSKATAGLSNLRCEYLTNPTGIDTTEPRLSWELLAGDPAGKRWTGSLKRHNKQRKEVNMSTRRVWARYVPLAQKAGIRGHFMLFMTKEQDIFDWS